MRINRFQSHIEEANKANINDAAGFYTWGNQVVKHTDGLYYSFMNRWADTDGFDGWVHYNSIYVSNGSISSEGPFTGYTEITALKGQTWCEDIVTNQNIIYHDGVYYLFFVGSNYSSVTYPAIDSEARNNQQIGLATATSPTGPWTLEPTNPILSPRSGKWDQNLVNNPSVYQDINGMWRMVYKSDYFTTKGDLRLGVAVSEDLINWEGRTDEPNFNLNGQAEDPYVWREGNTWYAIAKAFDGTITTAGDGLLLTSEDGVVFEIAEQFQAWDKTVNWTDMTSDTYSKEERPMVLVENGIGTTYYASILGGTNNSFNIARPLTNELPIPFRDVYEDIRDYDKQPDWFTPQANLAQSSNERLSTFLSHNAGMFISYGMTSFTASDSYATNYLSDPPVASTFAAPATVDSAQWATEAANLGCDYAILTTGHHIGFNIFPYTAQYNGGVSENTEDSTRGTLSVPVYPSYDISDTPSSDQNIIGKFLTQCVTEGIKSGLYYNIGKNINIRRGLDLIDAAYDQTETFSATYENYVAYAIDEIEYLLNNYTFDYLWLDAPHHFPKYEGNSRHREFILKRVYDAIKAINPNVLVVMNYDCAEVTDRQVVADGTDNTRPPFSHDGREMMVFPTDVISFEYFRTPDDINDLNPSTPHDFGRYYIPREVISTIYTGGQYFARNDVFQTLETAVTLQTKYDYCQTNNIPFLLNVAPQKNGVILPAHLTRFSEALQPLPESSIPTNNLVMYLRFNGDLVDQTGNITGITETLTTYTNGIWSSSANEAIRLAGTTRRVNIPDNDLLSFGDGLTDSPCSFTLGVETLTLATGGRFFSKRGDGTDVDANREYSILYNAGELDVIFWDQSEGAYIRRRSTTFGIGNNELCHLGVTYDGSGTVAGIKLYKNGVEETVYTDLTQGAYVAMENTAANPRVGRAAYSTGIAAAGDYDGLGVWNVELSATQMLEIYQKQSSGEELL